VQTFTVRQKRRRRSHHLCLWKTKQSKNVLAFYSHVRRSEFLLYRIRTKVCSFKAFHLTFIIIIIRLLSISCQKRNLSVVKTIRFVALMLTCRKNVIITAVLRKCVGYFSSSNSYSFSTDTNISGVGGRIGISGCRSLSQWLRNTFVDVVGKLDFVTWLTTMLIPDLFCHSSQHDHNIFTKNHSVDVTSNHFRCIDWRPDYCIFYPLHIQEKSLKDNATPNAEQNFLLIQKLSSELFLTPSAIGGLSRLFCVCGCCWGNLQPSPNHLARFKWAARRGGEGNVKRGGGIEGRADMAMGWVGVDLYFSLFHVFTNTTNFGGGNPIDAPHSIIGGTLSPVTPPLPGIAAHGLTSRAKCQN